MNNDDTYMSEEAWDAIRRDRGMCQAPNIINTQSQPVKTNLVT
jgi:hypothetical protein